MWLGGNVAGRLIVIQSGISGLGWMGLFGLMLFECYDMSYSFTQNKCIIVRIGCMI